MRILYAGSSWDRRAAKSPRTQAEVSIPSDAVKKAARS